MRKLLPQETFRDAEIGQRLLGIRKSLGLSADEFGKKLADHIKRPEAFRKTAIYGYEAGRVPDPKILMGYSSLGSRSVDWILNGNDSQSEVSKEKSVPRAIEVLRYEIGALRGDMAALLARLETTTSERPVVTVDDYLQIPYARDARAGAGPEAVNFDVVDNSCYAFRRSLLPEWIHPDSLIWIRAVGDSMEPTLHDEDLLLLDRSQTEPVDGCLVVVRTAVGLVVKRLRRSGRTWQLVSDNPAYQPSRVTKNDRVIGRVAWTGPVVPGR